MTRIKRVPTPAGDEGWLVTDYDLVKPLLADKRLGRSHPDPDNAPRLSDDAILSNPGKATMEEEQAQYAWMRRLLTPSFSARHMEALRPRVRQLVGDLLDGLRRQEQPADFHESVAFPLPLLVICELLGVPYADRETFRRWSEAASTVNDREKSLRGLGQLVGYLGELVARKKDEPGDDVITRMIEASPEGSEPLIAQLGAGLLFAGHETTAAAIGRGVVLLSEHPGQWRALRADPARVQEAVEEVLRHDSPVARTGEKRGMPRYALADLEVDGVRIATGDLVMLGLHQANLDPVRFPDPAAFDTARTPNPHLTFGFGPRFCVGAPLARIELTELFTALVTRFESFGLAVDVSELRLREDQLAGGVAELPVRWTEA